MNDATALVLMLLFGCLLVGYGTGSWCVGAGTLLVAGFLARLVIEGPLPRDGSE